MVCDASASDVTTKAGVFGCGTAVGTGVVTTASIGFSGEEEPVVPVGSFVDVDGNEDDVVAGCCVGVGTTAGVDGVGVAVAAGAAVGLGDGVGVVLLITVKSVSAVPVADTIPIVCVPGVNVLRNCGVRLMIVLPSFTV